MREASNGRTVTDTDSYAFSFINQSSQREDDRGTKAYMAIAKGLSINQAERCIVMQGFYEQLEVAQQSQYAQEANIKAKLYDIIEDNSLEEDEKNSLKKTLISELEEIENKHIRIRRSVLIGLYSFWEVSLKAILSSQSFISPHSNKGNLQIERTARKSAQAENAVHLLKWLAPSVKSSGV